MNTSYVATQPRIRDRLKELDVTQTSAIYLLQMKLLSSLFANMTRDMLLVKGGVAMRILTGVQRHTKDIDMAADPTVPMSTIKSHMRAAVNSAMASGLIERATFREQDVTHGGMSPKWHINGYVPGTDSKVHLTVEVSRRDKLPDEAISNIRYCPEGDIPSFTARTYTRVAMAASKVAAMLDNKRVAPRDAFDLYVMVTTQVEPPIDMLAALGRDDIKQKLEYLWEKLDVLNYQMYLSEVEPTLPREVADTINESKWDMMRIEVGEAVQTWLEYAYVIAKDEIPRSDIKNRIQEIKDRRIELTESGEYPPAKPARIKF